MRVIKERIFTFSLPLLLLLTNFLNVPRIKKERVRLYTEVGWTVYTDNLSTLRRGFENSLLVLAAFENNELIGIIRVVGDGFTIVFVQDILVFPNQQRKGIGSLLLQAIFDHYKNVRQIELVTVNTPQTIAFYKSMGFSELSELDCCGFIRFLRILTNSRKPTLTGFREFSDSLFHQ